MRTRSLVAPVGIAILLAASPAALAKTVNCELVRKDLKMGQWPADIALQMGITLKDVNSCQNAPATVPPRTATPQKSGTTKKGPAHDAGSKGT
jgi:hypothetical protein